MKMLRKIKVRSNKIFAYFSLFSMVANTLSPFAAMIPASAYAEDTTAPVEVSTEPAEESASEEADTEETADGQDLAEEEVSGNEITEEDGEEDGEALPEDDENSEEVVVDPEAPDILEDGVMDVNLVDEIEEVVEVEEIPTPVEEEVAPEVEEPVQIEYEELSDDAEIINSVKEDWTVDGEVAETKEVVRIGIKYIFPLDEEVTLTFTRLPKDEELRSHLKIERVKVEDLDLPDDFVTDAVYAFDITTDMENGDFEFDLTLPKPEGSEAEVSYIEKSVDEAKQELKDEDIKKVEEDKLEQGEEDDNVKVKDLDHFTIYIVETYSDTLLTLEEDEFYIGDTVYAKGTSNDNKWLRVRFRDSGNNVVETCDYSYGKVIDCSYDLSIGDPLGTWSVELQRWNSHTEDTVTFEVKEASIDVCNDLLDDYALDSSVGIWTSVDSDHHSNVTGEGTEEVRWGVSTDYGKSGLRFDPVGTQTFNENTQFLLGTLTHMNWPIYDAANGATLEIALSFSEPEILPDPTFDYYFHIEETPNNGSCAYGGNCNDKITFPSSYGDTVITIEDIQYTLVIDGFVDSYACEDIGSVLNYFITEEQKDNTAYLVGHLSSVLIEEPAISIIKKTNDTDVSSAPGPELTVGDAVSWQYIIQNTGNVDLTNVTITDNPSANIDCDPQTEGDQNSGLTLVSGASMTCTATGTVTEGNYSNTATVTGNPVGGSTVSDSDTSWYKGVLAEVKVDLCHATPAEVNPYNLINVSINSVSQCENASGHGDHDGDIIPPYTYGSCSYLGKNWDTLGQAIWDNDCEIPTGYIHVDKLIDTDADGSFSDDQGNTFANNLGYTWSIDDSGAYLMGTTEEISIGEGYEVTESYIDGFHTVGYYYGDGSCSSLDGTTLPAFIDVTAGQTSSVTFCNAVDTGEIIGTKYHDLNMSGSRDTIEGTSNTEPGLSGWTITLLDSNKNQIAQTITDDRGDYWFSDLPVGTYGVCETQQTGWKMTEPDFGGGCRDVTVVVDQQTWANFGNVQTGSITVNKVAAPSDTGDTFNIGLYDPLDIPINSFPLQHGQNGSFTDLLPGTYKLGEVYPAENPIKGWYLDYLMCDGSRFDIGSTFNLAAGQNMDCTFYNVKPGRIIVEKQTNPDGDPQLFNFETNYSEGFVLSDGQQNDSGFLTPTGVGGQGTYSVTEVGEENWNLGNVNCSDQSDPSAISLDPGEVITCVFTNEINEYCGDGIINGDEKCDYGELNGKEGSICSANCSLIRECLPNMAANGGFEIPTVSDPLGWDIFTNAEVPGWTAEWVGGSGGGNEPQIELHAGVNGWTSSSNQYVELDSDWDGPDGGLNDEAASISIYQNIPVLAGYEYRVSWSYSPRPNHDNNRLEVKVGDYVWDSGDIRGDTSVDWKNESHTFVADFEGNLIVRFTEIGTPDSLGMFLDNVSIECLGKPPLRLQAQKVMCDSEQYLPNERSKLSAITETTATDWVTNSNEHCWIESQWQFQWGPKNSGSNGGFQTDTSLLGYPWNTFTPSDVVEIRDLGELNGRLEVREVIPEGYTNPLVPFSNDSGNNYSSEFYCTGDIRNYDNWEWINNPQADTDYYCVGFDAYEYSYITGYKWNDKDGDGKFDGNESGLEGWNIKAVLPNAVDSFEVYANDVDGTDSKVLPAGDYLIVVEGTWQDTSQSNHYIDAEYYTFDSWESYMDGTGGSGGNQKDLQINNNLTNWGSYSDEHDFYYNYQQVSDGSANFAIYDGNAGGKIPSWYGDNEGSLTVTIYEVVDSTWTDADGSYELTIPGSIPDVRVFEIPQIGWVREYPELPYHVVTFDGPGDTQININFGNRIDEPVTIIATKIVCDYEEDLPNYGYGAPVNITENTASNWIASHPNCRLEPDWSFQWGDDGDTNPSDSHVGEVEGWNTFGPTNSDGTVVVEINDFGYTSQIKVREVLKENYIPFTYLTNGNNSDNFSAEIYCHTDVLNYDNDDRFTPEYGETYYCVAWNVQETYGIHGYKWDDQILNGIRDCNDDNADIVMASSTRGCRNWAEPTLPGWTINLYRWVDEAFETEPFKTTLTSSEPGDDFGWYWFEDLPPGRYKICEVQQNGWEQTFPVNESDNCHIVDLPDGNPNGYAVMENSLPEPEPAYNFGNEFITPRASIAKWNDSSEPEEVGNEVMFTIRVTAHDNDVVDAYAYDLFSEGFEYVEGSWTADSSDGRDLKALGITPEPVYASPASWYLGEIEEGEEVTLTYLARVTDQVDPGIYKDLAWTQGEDLLGGEVLGYAESEGYIDDDTFVGTEVEVVVENEIEDEVDVDEDEEGEVLGASTELPATGASTFWVNLMLVLASIGGLLLLIGGLGTMSTKKEKLIKKSKKAMLGLITVGFLTLFSFKVYAAPIMVRLSEPQSPVGGEFNLVFVAMDIDDNAMTATCEVKKPGSASFISFGSLITISAGDSGDSRTCAVTDSVLDDDGEYKFRVVVDPGDVSSNEVVVDYDGEGPDKPKYIEKEKVNDCVNKITLKTADDDETTSVQVFADDDKEIDIDDSHKIETESIGPDEKFDFEHIVSGDDCDKTWYYAVVAFDDAGNASKPRAEEITTTTTTTEEGEEETGAIPVEGGAGIVEGGATEGGATTGDEGAEGAEGTEGTQGTEVNIGEGEEGSVLGEQTGGEGKVIFKSPWFWIVSAGLGILIISATRKKKA